MNLCLDCGHLIEEGEERRWEERYGFTHGTCEKFSCCPLCGGCYVKVKPCTICGCYPAEEYEEDEYLPNGGICKECFDDSIENYFMDYLDSLDATEQMDFYCGEISGGYAYDPREALLAMKYDYVNRLKLSKHIFGIKREAKIWKSFISDGDQRKFVEFVLKKGTENE